MPHSTEPVTVNWLSVGRRLALYVVGTMAIAGVLQISDSVRPPYVGWKMEVLDW